MAWLAVGGALAVGLRGVARRLEPSVLLSPGLLLPLGLLAAAVGAVVVLRRSYGRREVVVAPDRLQIRPSTLARVVSGDTQRSLALPKAQAIRLLTTRDGARLALFGEDPAPPLLVELARADIGSLLSALDAAPEDAWSHRARAAADTLADGGEAVLTTRQPRAAGPELANLCRAAGLWQLAADALWPTVLAHPDDLHHVLDLHAGERHRLPCVTRLGLLQALLTRHESSADLLLDYARICLVLRNRPEAKAALDHLVKLNDPSAVGVRWRQVLHEKRQVPAPQSKASFGIEVSLPSHRLEGDTLVVDERWKVGLDWFVAYRLLAGFWGPPRRLQLIDIWGAAHMILGNTLDWAARLERAAPHLCEVHDEGLLWPGTGARIRRLRRR